MRFESGGDKIRINEIIKNGEKLDAYDKYVDLNLEEVDGLLEKRKAEDIEFEKRKKERLEKLEKMEKEGILFVKE